jgi:hypothetical protein
MMNEIDRARKFMTDAEAKLKDHDKRLSESYFLITEVMNRVSALERRIDELLRKP